MTLIQRMTAWLFAGDNWGEKLFYFTLVALLVFFWWLLIYSGGVTIHHG